MSFVLSQVPYYCDMSVLIYHNAHVFMLLSVLTLYICVLQIYDAEGTLQHFIDGNDPSKSSWMRYIRCARHCGEQNMMVVQYR